MAYLILESSSLNSAILSLTTPFIDEKICMSNKSSMMALRSPGDNCMNGTKEAEPRMTTCVKDL